MPIADLDPVDRRATADVVAESLRERIIDGTFEPGLQLTEAHLAEALGVSRGPLREAFQRLVQEGLLVAEPHRGVFVRTLDGDDLADVLLARATIERTAADRVARAGRPEVLDRLRALVEDMSAAATAGRGAEVAESDLRFHEALVAGAGSERLVRMYATLLAETRLCLHTMPDRLRAPDEVVAEHRALLAALVGGDALAAVACVDAHLAPSPLPAV